MPEQSHRDLRTAKRRPPELAPMSFASLIAFFLFVLTVAYSTQKAVEHYRHDKTLVAVTNVSLSSRHIEVAGRTRAPADLTLFLDSVPIFEEVGKSNSKNRSLPPSRNGDRSCTPVPCSFVLAVPDSVPAPALGKKLYLTARSADNPSWDAAAMSLDSLSPHGGSHSASYNALSNARTIHIWVSPYSLRYSAIVSLPENAILFQAFLSGFQRSFLQEALDVTVDQFYNLWRLNPRIQVFKNSHKHRALVVINGDTNSFTFNQSENLRIADNGSAWLTNNAEARRGGRAAFRPYDETLILTVTGFSIKNYAVLDPGSHSADTLFPSALWRSDTVTWYGHLSGERLIHLALSRNAPKNFTDIRTLLKQSPPPIWSPWNIPVGILQIAILGGLLFALFTIMRSGAEAPIVSIAFGILTANTSISLFARLNTLLGWRLAQRQPALHEYVAYVVLLALMIVALACTGWLLFDRFKVPGARKPFVVTVLASCLIVVIATWLSVKYQPHGAFTLSSVNYGNPETLLSLQGACCVLAFALLLIQFRPDVFSVVLPIPQRLRWCSLVLGLAFLAACAWYISPVLPPDGMNTVGLYLPAPVVSEIALFAKNLAPLLFALLVLMPGLFSGHARRWQGREWSLALFLSIMCVGSSYIFLGIPIGLIFSVAAIRFLAIRTEHIHDVDNAVAARDAQEIMLTDIIAFQDIRRARLAQLAAKDAFFSGKSSEDEYHRNSAAFVAYATKLQRSLGPKASYEWLVLGYEFGPGQTVVENARIGAILGLVAGAVMAALQLHNFVATFSDGRAVLFNSVAVLALTVLHWVPAGFAFGFLLAYLRGNMATTKGFVLALALCVGLIPYDFFQFSSSEAVSESLRLLLLFGTLGLVLDLLTAWRLARTLSFRQLLGVTGILNVSATFAIAASIAVALITEASRSLLDVAVQAATATLHTALSNNQWGAGP
jgi:hypothetical protein